MLVASLLDYIFDIERTSLTRIQLANANFDFRAQTRESVDTVEQLTPDLLLSSIRQRRHFAKRQFQRFHHDLAYHNERRHQSFHFS